jgi:hypothetical protein
MALTINMFGNLINHQVHNNLTMHSTDQENLCHYCYYHYSLFTHPVDEHKGYVTNYNIMSRVCKVGEFKVPEHYTKRMIYETELKL